MYQSLGKMETNKLKQIINFSLYMFHYIEHFDLLPVANLNF